MSLNKETLNKNHEKLTDENSSTDKQLAGSDDDFFGPALPPHLLNRSSSVKNECKKIYGPVLPSDFMLDNSKMKIDSDEVTLSDSGKKDDIVIGPEIPEHLKSALTAGSEAEEAAAPVITDDDNFGPSTTLMAKGDDTAGYYNFPSASKEKTTKEQNLKRESWMTELPEKKRAHLGLLPRHFKTQVPTDKEADDSVWTDTPEEKQKKEKHGKKKDHKEILEMMRLEERDKEMEKLAKKAAKKLRKKGSLMEMHLKSIKKKEKKEAKNREKEGKTVPERRPFDRNVDLQIRKIDENQRRAMLNKSQFLNDRFAPGQSKFL